MKKETPLNELSTEELQKKLKSAKTNSVIINGIVLFMYTYVLFRMKDHETGNLIVFPTTLTITAVFLMNKVKKMKEELKSRGMS